MRNPKIVSARGVYYDLSKSPYEFNYEDLKLKFSSKKKLEIFEKRFTLDKIKIEQFCDTYNLKSWKKAALRQLAEQTYKSMRRV